MIEMTIWDCIIDSYPWDARFRMGYLTQLVLNDEITPKIAAKYLEITVEQMNTVVQVFKMVIWEDISLEDGADKLGVTKDTLYGMVTDLQNETFERIQTEKTVFREAYQELLDKGYSSWYACAYLLGYVEGYFDTMIKCIREEMITAEIGAELIDIRVEDMRFAVENYHPEEWEFGHPSGYAERVLKYIQMMVK